MLICETVRYKNFLASGDQWTEIKLNTHSTTLILGENGQGKSTILDALTYGFFGKAYRNINKPQLVNSINQADMLVEVEFSVGRNKYMIRRGMKPGIFEVYVNDKMLDQDSRAYDYQDHLERNILHLNYQSFCQIVVLGIATFTPFMQLPAAQRRFIIEDLLDIKIFSAMNVVLKKKWDNLTEEDREIQRKGEIREEKSKLIESYIAQAHADNKKMIAENSALIKQKLEEKLQVVRDIEDVSKTVDELSKQTAQSDSLSNKVRQLESFESKLEEKVKNLQKEIKFFQENNECPTCRQAIDENFKVQEIEKRTTLATKCEQGLEDLKKEYEKASSDLEAVRKVAATIRSHEVDIQILNNKIKFIEQNIVEVEKDIEALKNKKQSSVDNENQLKELNKELRELRKKKNECTELSHYYDLVSLMLKDTGIKTKIIRQYIPVINKLVNKYLTAMNFFVNFHLDENFNEVIKSRGRDEFSYASFSEGEKLRIDLSLLFTWREIAKMKNSANTNLLILDEIFDSSLDPNGTEEFMKLIQQIGGGNNIFVISHKGDTLIDKFNNTIRFKKDKNFSVMVGD